MGRFVPERLKRFVRSVRYRGTARSCPLCRRDVSEFLPAGLADRSNAMCPVCEGLERHRMIGLHLDEGPGLVDRRFSKALHFAPHPAVARCIERISDDYLSVDLDPDFAMCRADITDLQFDDEEFDLIVCSHVLEHVPDDRTALRELCRVLMRGGVLLLLVPLTSGPTFEDPGITDPRERERLFGQDDHVRVCGEDYIFRIRDAGLVVSEISSETIFGPDRMVSHGGLTGEVLFDCRRPLSVTT